MNYQTAKFPGFAALTISFAVLTIASCQAGDQQVGSAEKAAVPTPTTRSFDDIFHLLREVVLEEPDTAPIGQVSSFAPFGDSIFIIADGMSSRVRVYGLDGHLRSSVGRAGGGPGEFLGLQAAAVDDRGRIHTVELRSPRINRFSLDGRFEGSTEFGTGTGIVGAGDSLLLAVQPGEPRKPTLTLITGSGSQGRRFLLLDTLYSSVPYWGALLRIYPAITSNAVYGVTALLYPLRKYDLETGTETRFGSPPPSWREPTHPQAGQFAGPSARSALASWLNTLTVIAGLFPVNDTVLVVAHGRFNASVTQPPPEFFRVRQHAVDVYGRDNRKVAEDVATSEQIVAGGRYLYTIRSGPPGSWKIGVYELKH